MGNLALVIIGLFVLVWIVSAVAKAGSATKQPPRTERERERQRRDAPPVERTSANDIDRFMAEIDRLRRRGEGAPAGPGRQAARPVAVPPVQDVPRPPRPREDAAPRRTEPARRARAQAPARPAAPPPPLPRDPVPVLRPVQAPPSVPASVVPPTSMSPAAPAKPATVAAVTSVSSSSPSSPVMATLHALLKAKQGPAAGLVLAEIFGEPRSRRPMGRNV